MNSVPGATAVPRRVKTSGLIGPIQEASPEEIRDQRDQAHVRGQASGRRAGGVPAQKGSGESLCAGQDAALTVDEEGGSSS